MRARIYTRARDLFISKMKDLVALKQNPTQFLSMTSLTIEEFEILHDTSESYCTDYFLYHTLQGKTRRKVCYREQKNASLRGSEMKLFFLISLFKEPSITTISCILFWSYPR